MESRALPSTSYYDGNNIIAEKDSGGTVTAKYFYDGSGKLLSMKKNHRSPSTACRAPYKNDRVEHCQIRN